MRERLVEAELVAQVASRGGLCLKWESPGCRGVPDRIVLLPGARVAFVEVKSPTGVLRPEQVRMLRRIRALGFRVAVLRSRDGAAPLVASI